MRVEKNRLQKVLQKLKDEIETLQNKYNAHSELWKTSRKAETDHHSIDNLIDTEKGLEDTIERFEKYLDER